MRTKTDLDKHVTEQHITSSDEDVLLVCNECEKEFEHVTDYHSHVSTHSIVTSEESLKESSKRSSLLKEIKPEVDAIGDTLLSSNKGDVCDDVINVKDSSPSVQTKDSSFKCENCQFSFPEKTALEKHIKTNHDTPITSGTEKKFVCEKCDFTSQTEPELQIHKQITHMTSKVTLLEKDMRVIECTKCSYTCKLNIQLKKHIEKTHKNEQLHTCYHCEYSSSLIANVWEHNLSQHQEQVNPILPKNSNEMIQKINAELITSLIEEMEIFKKDTKVAFMELTNLIKENFEAIRSDNEEKCSKITNTFTKLHRKMSKVENTVLLTDYIDNHGKKKNRKKKEVEVDIENALERPTNVNSTHEITEITKEIKSNLDSVISSQNEIKQEVFVVRNNQALMMSQKVSPQVQRSKGPVITNIASKRDEGRSNETFASVVSSSQEKNKDDHRKATKEDKGNKDVKNRVTRGNEKDTDIRGRPGTRSDGTNQRNQNSARYKSRQARPLSYHQRNMHRTTSFRDSVPRFEHSRRHYGPRFERPPPFYYPRYENRNTHIYPRHENFSENWRYNNLYEQPRLGYRTHEREYEIPLSNRFSVLGNY